jgi:hypothetical protein
MRTACSYIACRGELAIYLVKQLCREIPKHLRVTVYESEDTSCVQNIYITYDFVMTQAALLYMNTLKKPIT